jgi:hypothetical protein
MKQYSVDYYQLVARSVFFWTWFAVTCRSFIPGVSVSVVSNRLDWVSLGVL